ncbi:hypothetical protein JZ751_005397 [Albula glossodonta]|uniref:G-patch domain and KOW motifs-containing protein n=1 Tax=Albula glossodonta TaxID=121402 RepID=A0A8T2N4Y2_9TELE|nr:hypothetical protein JZ751_005397 [Albula glossodonta]
MHIGECSTKPDEKAKELIIPLINKNRWYKPDGTGKSSRKDGDSQLSQEQDSVESQAVKELIEESHKKQEQWENGTQADPNLSIPLLMQNQVPEGYEDGDQVKVDLRPESSTDADYESVPVEAYGMAMLKGMGWKEGEGIGRTFKQDVKPIEHQLRPKGLGLGADRSALKDLEPSGRSRPLKPGEERAKDEEALVLGPGGCVLVQSGAHKDLYGKIEGVDPDNARVMVKLAIGGKMVTISQYAVQLVGRKEYDKYSKDLSRLSKAHKEKEKEKKEREKEWGNVKQGMLETVVPRGESDFVMVVMGEHKGQVGRILQRDREKCRAMVQLEKHEERVHTLGYDSICQYVGGGYD